MGNVFNDISTELLELVKSCKSELLISSPWIKKEPLNSIIEVLKDQKVNYKILTKMDVIDYANRASDIEAIECLFKQNAEIRVLRELHAKIFIADSSHAIITSANLTEAGTGLNGNKNSNAEIGVKITDITQVNKTKEVFLSFYNNAEILDKSTFDKFCQQVINNKDVIREYKRNLSKKLKEFNVYQILKEKKQTLEQNNTNKTNKEVFDDNNKNPVKEFYDLVLKSIKDNLDKPMADRVINNNTKIRKGFVQTYSINGFSELNFVIRPHKKSVESVRFSGFKEFNLNNTIKSEFATVSIHDNTYSNEERCGKWSKLYDRICIDKKIIQDKYGITIERKKGRLISKQINSKQINSTWNPETARSIGEELAKYIKIVYPYLKGLNG